MKTAIVIPTIKTIPDSILSLDEVDLIIVRDKGKAQLSDEFDTIQKRSDWLNEYVGFAPDFLLRQQGDSARNFGMLVAYQRGYERVISMDDDVEIPKGFLNSHKLGMSELKETTTCRFLDVMDYMDSNVRQRGYPFELRDEHSSISKSTRNGNVKMNIGLWSGIPDCGAIDKILGIDWKCKCDMKERVAIPVGTDAATCTMNLSMSRDVIPAFYQPDMCVEIAPGMQLDRFADMWSGYILKKLIDIKGDVMSFGAPVVEHLKEGDLNRELVGEYVGNMMYRDFRRLAGLAIAQIVPDTYKNMYKQISYDFGGFNSNCASIPKCYRIYFELLAHNMLRWIECIEKIDEGMK